MGPYSDLQLPGLVAEKTPNDYHSRSRQSGKRSGQRRSTCRPVARCRDPVHGYGTGRPSDAPRSDSDVSTRHDLLLCLQMATICEDCPLVLHQVQKGHEEHLGVRTVCANAWILILPPRNDDDDMMPLVTTHVHRLEIPNLTRQLTTDQRGITSSFFHGLSIFISVALITEAISMHLPLPPL